MPGRIDLNLNTAARGEGHRPCEAVHAAASGYAALLLGVEQRVRVCPVPLELAPATPADEILENLRAVLRAAYPEEADTPPGRHFLHSNASVLPCIISQRQKKKTEAHPSKRSMVSVFESFHLKERYWDILGMFIVHDFSGEFRS